MPLSHRYHSIITHHYDPLSTRESDDLDNDENDAISHSSSSLSTLSTTTHLHPPMNSLLNRLNSIHNSCSTVDDHHDTNNNNNHHSTNVINHELLDVKLSSRKNVHISERNQDHSFIDVEPTTSSTSTFPMFQPYNNNNHSYSSHRKTFSNLRRCTRQQQLTSLFTSACSCFQKVFNFQNPTTPVILVSSLFILIAFLFIGLGLVVLLSVSGWMDLSGQAHQWQPPEYLLEWKNQSFHHTREHRMKYIHVVKEWPQEALAFKEWLRQHWKLVLETPQYGKLNESQLDLIVFRMDDSSFWRPVELNSEMISKALEQVQMNLPSPMTFRIHVVDASTSEIHIGQTLTRLLESYENSWLMVITHDDIPLFIPSILYPLNHLISHQVLNLIMYHRYQVESMSQTTIPKTFQERFEMSTNFWFELIENDIYELDRVFTHTVRLEQYSEQVRSLISPSLNAQSYRQIMELLGHDMLNAEGKCTVMALTLPKKVNEEKHASMSEDYAKFLQRHKGIFSSLVPLFITNDRNMYFRGDLIFKKVIYLENSEFMDLIAKYYCYQYYRTPKHEREDQHSMVNIDVDKGITTIEIDGVKHMHELYTYRHSKKSTKIIHLAIQIGNRGHSRHLESYAMQLARYLSEISTSFQVTVMYCSRKKDSKTFRYLQTFSHQVHRVEQIHSKQEYERILKEESISMVHAFDSLYGIKSCHDMKIPFIQTLESPYRWLVSNQKKKKSKDFLQKMDTLTSMHVAMSTDVAQFSDLELGMDVSKMLVLRRGLDPQSLENCQRFLHYLPTQKRHVWNQYVEPLTKRMVTEQDVVLTQLDTNITPESGHHLSIVALYELKKRFHDQFIMDIHPVLLLVGEFKDFKWRSHLKQLVTEYGLSNEVFFLEDRANIQKLYCHLFLMSDVMLHPALFEGWSSLVAESVYMKMDLVSTVAGGSLEIVSQFKDLTTIEKFVDPPSTIFEISADNSVQLNLEKVYPEFCKHYAETIHEVISTRRALGPMTSFDDRRGEDMFVAHSHRGYKRLYEMIDMFGISETNIPWLIRHAFRRGYQ
ncbi:hypothetical protein C9374_005860 [Naegleria lovaniensis]|uniref:Glycosyl transferase family 1 domain-containing protein n=1 Tax=Naegleria lovaniensis TaxID=51637 RepID=A0AA88KJP2_NAELO|nr:uncharacterized protein C9374_005860 [Naegleria lovaniensis]KAG2382068.1 hypothetical protein C9374_005860 [Naegleria lovaniensis]